MADGGAQRPSNAPAHGAPNHGKSFGGALSVAVLIAVSVAVCGPEPSAILAHPQTEPIPLAVADERADTLPDGAICCPEPIAIALAVDLIANNSGI